MDWKAPLQTHKLAYNCQLSLIGRKINSIVYVQKEWDSLRCLYTNQWGIRNRKNLEASFVIIKTWEDNMSLTCQTEVLQWCHSPLLVRGGDSGSFMPSDCIRIHEGSMITNKRAHCMWAHSHTVHPTDNISKPLWFYTIQQLCFYPGLGIFAEIQSPETRA